MPPHPKKFANHWHGSQPTGKLARLGTPAIRQRTTARHYALASVGPSTLAAEVAGRREFFNGPHVVERTAFEWLLRNNLIQIATPSRPGGAQPVLLTGRGREVLAAWNEQHGEISFPDTW